MSSAEDRITGKLLNEKWDVGARHALYREDGTWYHKLTEFPGALFDSNGYIVFPTEEAFYACPQLQIAKDVHIPEGITSIPGYVFADDPEDQVRYEGGSIYPYEMPEEVDIREEPYTVFEWLRKLNSDRLTIDPEFQRNLVWKPEQKSLFIESVLLNIPLPPLYVNQSKNGNYIIVDGLQRTSTLSEYVNKDAFVLSDLKVLPQLNGRRFSELEKRLQTKIEDKKFFVYVIKPTVPLQMVYDIFHRINTGGTQLTRQEIRNCFFIGQATRFLKHLAEQPDFKRAISAGISPKRMKDREAILRCLAFTIQDYKEDYKNDMDAFLGHAMNRMNLLPREDLDVLATEFARVMVTTYEFWGENNFRLPTATTRGRINIALMESVFSFFSTHNNDTLLEHKETIIANYEDLLLDGDYINAIQFATGDKRRVLQRFERAQTVLGRF